jgi:hypothetical protein
LNCGADEENRLLFDCCPQEESSVLRKDDRRQIFCGCRRRGVVAPINNASPNIEMALLSDSHFSMDGYDK